MLKSGDQKPMQTKRSVLNTKGHKKHFMKNVKECRDVNRQKKYQNKVGMLSSHITHTLDPQHRPNRKSAMRSKVCVRCDDSIPTLF